MPVPNLPPILPVGTAVVVLIDIPSAAGRVLHPRGTAATITKSPADPEHSYRVRFPGGDEASVRRASLEVLARYSGITRADPLARHDLFSHVILRVVIGSRAYGLEHDASDMDRRGVYLPPASMHWSIYGVPEQLENDQTQEVYWELEKFLGLALRANPNVLECLYSPLVEHADETGKALLAIRERFLSRLVYQTFNGYAMSQFKKLGQDLRTKGEIKWKHAMHLIRLLLAGIECLRAGVLPVRVDSGKERLLQIRDGEMAWDDVDAWRLELHREFEEAFTRSTLPERPDYEAADALLIEARRRMARQEPAP
jgi:hypothetical protein